MPTDEEKALARKQEIAALCNPSAASGPSAIIEPTGPLPPRRAHCQRTDARARTAKGGELGTVAWEEHAEACRVRGVDPEKVAAAGGLDFAAMALLLGREPGTWKRWTP